MVAPENYPDHSSGAMSELNLNVGQEIFLNIQPMPVSGSILMRNVPPSSRGCVFTDEKLLVYDRFYTFSECNMICQMEDIIKFCGCYPWHFNSLFNVSVCLLTDLPCLARWHTKWYNQEPGTAYSTLRRYKSQVQCSNCMPTCNYIRYKSQMSFAYLNSMYLKRRNYLPLRLEELSARNITIAHIYYGDAFVTEYQQTIVNTWYDLVSILGGIISLMLGASIVSVAEYLYFQTGRFGILFLKQKRIESTTQIMKTTGGSKMLLFPTTNYSENNSVTIRSRLTRKRKSSVNIVDEGLDLSYWRSSNNLYLE